MLQPLIDPTFSQHSHGFRPGRRSRDAVLAAQWHVQDGYRIVVDADLQKFFDRVNHDGLMTVLRNACLTRLNPAHTCLSVRGHHSAGERVMALLRRLYGKLHLKTNESKSAVASAFGQKFLGTRLWEAPKDEVKCAVSIKARETFRQRIRQLTRRSGGHSLAEVI